MKCTHNVLHGGGGAKSTPNRQLAGELYKPIIKKFKKRKVYSSFTGNIWGTDLADMQLISKYNCVIDIFSKYAWFVPLKIKKGVIVVNAFQSTLNDSGRKPNKIRVDQRSEFYHKSFKKCLNDDHIKMYSTFIEGISAVAKIFIRMPKHRICKDMTAVFKNVYIDVLDGIVDKYNNTYYQTIKMKPADVKPGFYAEYSVDSNAKNVEFKIGDQVRISKYKNFFAKGYAPNWSEEAFMIIKVKNTVSWLYVISDLSGEEIGGTFYEKGL